MYVTCMRFHVVLYMARELAKIETRFRMMNERRACYLAMMHQAGHDGDRLTLAINLANGEGNERCSLYF